MTEFVSENWHFLVAIVAVIIWAVRVESKVQLNSKSIDRLFKNKKDYEKFQEEVLKNMTELKSDMKWLKEFGRHLFKHFNKKEK